MCLDGCVRVSDSAFEHALFEVSARRPRSVSMAEPVGAITLTPAPQGDIEKPHPDNAANTKLRWLCRLREHLGLPPRELWLWFE